MIPESGDKKDIFEERKLENNLTQIGLIHEPAENSRIRLRQNTGNNKVAPLQKVK